MPTIEIIKKIDNFAKNSRLFNQNLGMKSPKNSKFLQTTFGFNAAEHNIRVEVIAGITTFLTMAYILAVNPNIVSSTGMDKGALFTTTVLVSAFATMLMGLYAKCPSLWLRVWVLTPSSHTRYAKLWATRGNLH